MGAVLRQAEVSGQSAEFGLLGFAVDVDPPDGVPFLNVIHILEKVQVQEEALRGTSLIFSLCKDTWRFLSLSMKV